MNPAPEVNWSDGNEIIYIIIREHMCLIFLPKILRSQIFIFPKVDIGSYCCEYQKKMEMEILMEMLLTYIDYKSI